MEGFMKSAFVGILGALGVVMSACSTGSAGGAGPASGDAPAGSAPESSSANDPHVPHGPSAAPFASMLRVHLVDAPTDEVASIVVTIAKIEASIHGEWIAVSSQEHTVDLLTLQNGAFLDLGATSLPAGHVEQVRLILADGGDHHVVSVDGENHPLTVPSGAIKLVGGFDLEPCSTAQLTIDFDGKRSLHPRGRPGAADPRWMLQPVVRMQALVTARTCNEAADAGDAPFVDTCAAVTCAEAEICDNGTCRAAQ
jgi:hypothetical protein